MRLPKQVEGIVFRNVQNRREFLLLKRIKSRGGFWQFITGGMEDFDDSLIDSIKRELIEEIGVNKKEIIQIIDNVGLFEFNSSVKNKEQIIKEYVFGIELNPNVLIKIDLSEHEKFKWVNSKEAIKLLDFDNNKKALELLIKKI